MTSTPSSSSSNQASTLLTLPAEIRNTIFQHVFDDAAPEQGFTNHEDDGSLVLDRTYRASDRLRPFSACQQLHREGTSLAWSRTNFILNNRFTRAQESLTALNPSHFSDLRNLSVVATNTLFWDLIQWDEHAFRLPNLQLDTLTLVLHSPSVWHHLFDFTTGITYLLRKLQNVRRLVFVRNRAFVKGGFRTWYNRLIGLIMKVDHFQRYDKIPMSLERTWWTWKFDATAQTICLEAQPPKPWVGEEAYMQIIRPLMEDLKSSIEYEDPAVVRWL